MPAPTAPNTARSLPPWKSRLASASFIDLHALIVAVSTGGMNEQTCDQAFDAGGVFDGAGDGTCYYQRLCRARQRRAGASRKGQEKEVQPSGTQQRIRRLRERLSHRLCHDL